MTAQDIVLLSGREPEQVKIPWDEKPCLRSETPMNAPFVSAEKLELASCKPGSHTSRRKSMHIVHKGSALECSDQSQDERNSEAKV